MNKKIKKLIVSLFTVALFVAPTATFAATLNGDPQDFATLRVFNYTDAPSCSTCWSGVATAGSEDLVNFAIYYHNSGSDTATNVRLKLTPQTTANGTTHTFFATVSADNAPTVSGTAVVTTTTNQTITFTKNGMFWRPNQTVDGSSVLPFGQTPSDLFGSSGINLGNVAPGLSTQVSLVVRFQVSSVSAPVPNVTLPFVSTNSASSVSQNSATLNGNVTPNGANTNAWFEWGTTASIGKTTTTLRFGKNASTLSSALFNINSNTT